MVFTVEGICKYPSLSFTHSGNALYLVHIRDCVFVYVALDSYTDPLDHPWLCALRLYSWGTFAQKGKEDFWFDLKHKSCLLDDYHGEEVRQ